MPFDKATYISTLADGLAVAHGGPTPTADETNLATIFGDALEAGFSELGGSSVTSCPAGAGSGTISPGGLG